MLSRRGILRLFIQKRKSSFSQLNRFISNWQPDFVNNNLEQNDNPFLKKVFKYENKILYNTFTHGEEMTFRDQKLQEIKQRHKEHMKDRLRQSGDSIPISLSYLPEYKELTKEDETEEYIPPQEVEKPAYFPFKMKNIFLERENVDLETKSKIGSKQWMTDYDCFDDSKLEIEDVKNDDEDGLWKLNYGSPDPNVPASDVKCGGCGAILHCINTTIPGYLPSDIFKCYKAHQLQGIVCQRCHFLSEFNVALNLNVNTEEYPKIISKMKEEKALAVLLVDLLDFPNSIWPDIVDIIGKKRPVIIVGNKIDMLPPGEAGYLNHIAHCLKDTSEKYLQNIKIKDVALISAKTGYGIEDLITKIHTIWQHQGDIYIIGCTNVGKSTLFNALLQSDLCKSSASDIIQKATVSQWPGTTLNLLKFPIFRIHDWKLNVRRMRLDADRNRLNMEKELAQSDKNSDNVTLMGYIGRSFINKKNYREISGDPFSYTMTSGFTSPGRKMGIEENSRTYILSKWCYDTPGVVHPEQILSILTLDELKYVLPKTPLKPRTYYVRHGSTLFLAGLGRIDFVYGKTPVRFTVFASEDLPVTVCNTCDADELYAEFLGTPLLGVPFGNEERLKVWPMLESGEEMTVVGEGDKSSCADVTLSSAGWVAITGNNGVEYKVLPWTPEKKGINLRIPSVLPDAVKMRGKRIYGTPAYNKLKQRIRYIL